MVNDVIKFKDFVIVINDALIEAEQPKGNILFVAGSQPIQEDKDDLYNLRTKLIVCPVNNGHIVSDKFLMVDPRNVEKVSNSKQKKLTRIMEEDFKPKDEATN